MSARDNAIKRLSQKRLSQIQEEIVSLETERDKVKSFLSMYDTFDTPDTYTPPSAVNLVTQGKREPMTTREMVKFVLKQSSVPMNGREIYDAIQSNFRGMEKLDTKSLYPQISHMNTKYNDITKKDGKWILYENTLCEENT